MFADVSEHDVLTKNADERGAEEVEESERKGVAEEQSSLASLFDREGALSCKYRHSEVG